MQLERSAIWLLIFVTTYTLGHALWYWQTPLGQFPVLDGLENLNLADRIETGNLANEPFYRAMLYPALLAVLPIHWMVLGIICHLANTLIAMQLSKRIWERPLAALVTGILVGFNPVLLHFALDPLDITLAITLLLFGLYFLVRGTSIPSWQPWALAGLFISLAALTRPHSFAILIPLLAIATFAAFILKGDRARFAAFAGSAILPLLVFGLIQKSHSGSFRILPTQGAYNFWVSNNAKANGLYYEQSLFFNYIGDHKNPAELEAEQLYLQETGKAGTIDERSDYWKSKTIEYISNNPLAWAKLVVFKTYAWLNNFEQYNNKTYSFHKTLSPYFSHNPISWGLLFSLAFFPLVLTVRNRDKKVIWMMLMVIALYSAGALLYMASARFRLPLIPLLAILAGGVPVAYASWKTASQLRRVGSIAFGIGIATLSFSSAGSIASTETYQQDTMLLADASSRAGRDLEAFNWSEATLALNPNRQDARRLRVLSFYNLKATGQEIITRKTWDDFRDDLDLITLSDPYIEYVRGVAKWSCQQPDAARNIWKDTFQEHAWDASASLAALIYTDSTIDFSIPSYPSNRLDPNPLLVFTLSRPEQSDLRKRIGFDFTQSNDYYASIEASLQRVFQAQPNRRH